MIVRLQEWPLGVPCETYVLGEVQMALLEREVLEKIRKLLPKDVVACTLEVKVEYIAPCKLAKVHQWTVNVKTGETKEATQKEE